MRPKPELPTNNWYGEFEWDSNGNLYLLQPGKARPVKVLEIENLIPSALALLGKADMKELFDWLESRAPVETQKIRKNVGYRNIAQLEFCLYELIHILRKQEALEEEGERDGSTSPK